MKGIIKGIETRAAKAPPIKFPVKDEQLSTVCPASPPLPLPEPKYPYTLPMELFGDVVSIWDFLSTFK
jgi:hypothetical protein